MRKLLTSCAVLLLLAGCSRPQDAQWQLQYETTARLVLPVAETVDGETEVVYKIFPPATWVYIPSPTEREEKRRAEEAEE